MNLIEKAVAPIKQDAIDRAQQEATEYVEAAAADLEEAGWDINKAAPYPFGLGHSFAYYGARYRYDNFHQLTKQDPALGYQSSGRNAAIFVVMDEERVARFIKARMDQAAAEYDAFVIKLVAKIGEVTAASLDGNHVWGYSILSVTTKAGEDQRWKTQQITNVSKYGKFFNQWPTRKMK